MNEVKDTLSAAVSAALERRPDEVDLSSPRCAFLRDLQTYLARMSMVRETRRMPNMNAVLPADLDEIVTLIEDAADLTPKELEQERQAKVEELKKLGWMSHTAEQLAGRIPVSVFAMGDLVAAG